MKRGFNGFDFFGRPGSHFLFSTPSPVLEGHDRILRKYQVPRVRKKGLRGSPAPHGTDVFPPVKNNLVNKHKIGDPTLARNTIFVKNATWSPVFWSRTG